MTAFTRRLPNPNQDNTMKQTTLAILALSSFLIVGCDQQKAAIDSKAAATKEAIENTKDAVNTAAADATKQTDANATIVKADIEASKESAQAQLDADKKKADAEATAAKAAVDAAKK